MARNDIFRMAGHLKVNRAMLEDQPSLRVQVREAQRKTMMDRERDRDQYGHTGHAAKDCWIPLFVAWAEGGDPEFDTRFQAHMLDVPDRLRNLLYRAEDPDVEAVAEDASPFQQPPIMLDPEVIDPKRLIAALDAAPFQRDQAIISHLAEAVQKQIVPTKVDEPNRILAVVEDLRGVSWYRWALDSHTSRPWRVVGTQFIHTDTERRWEDVHAITVVFDGMDPS